MTKTRFERPVLPKDATEEDRRKAMFDALYSLDLSDKLERRENDKLSYLSWANAWAEFKRAYPNAEYRIIKDPTTYLPYFNDHAIGIMVYTEVTADNQTYEMWLPVMDVKNKAMKEQPYTYQVYDSYKKTYVEKAIMRCLVKNLAMFGLGLYVYAGEDLSNEENLVAENNLQRKQQPKRTRTTVTTPTATSQQQADKYSGIRTALSLCNDNTSLMNLYRQHQNEVEGNAEIKAMFTQRKNQLKAA